MDGDGKNNPFATPLRYIALIILIIVGIVILIVVDKDNQTEAAIGYLIAAVGYFALYSQFEYRRRTKDSRTPEQINRANMLRNVHQYWIEGVLEKALHEKRKFDVEIQMTEPGVVLKQYPNDTKLPANMPIEQIFDEVDHHLLILGDRGSGKTIKLLQLANVLLKHAEANEKAPIPAVFNLSSWAAQRKALQEWLKDELRTKYQVSKKLAEYWVEHEKILPLLDGLDEVAKDYGNDCVDAINAYQKKYQSVEMAICSRTADYDLLTSRLDMRQAVIVQPLAPKQIDAYLAGHDFVHVRNLMETDSTLQDFARTPFLLNTIGFAYRGTSRGSLLLPMGEENEQGRKKDLFNRYIERRLHETPSEIYSPLQTRHYLTWLAGKMVEYKQSVFYIESLQPDWLSIRKERWIFRLLGGLFGGLIFGLPLGFSVGLILWLSIGLVDGLLIGLRAVIYIDLTFGLAYGLLIWWRDDWDEIKTVESIGWSFSREGLISGLSMGLVIGVCGLGTGQYLELNGIRLGLYLVLPVSLGLFVGQGKGLKTSSRVLTRTSPNDGIWQTLFNTLRISVLTGLPFGLFLGLVAELTNLVVNGLVLGLGFWLAGGLISGLGIGGGQAVIKHVVLRFMLWRNGSTPRNYADFLDYCAACMLLRKVGGGYIFIHRELLEYFAGLEVQS